MQTIKHLFRLIHRTYSNVRLTTPVAIILAAVIIGISHVTYGALLSGTSATPATIFKGKAIDASDLVTGNAESKVLAVEYSDTECPYCAQLHPTIKKLKEEYASKVGFVYRYFPLTQIHPNAFGEAQAIHCVGKIMGAEKRAAYINDIFTYKINKQNMVLPQGGKEDLAANLGVDKVKFKACLASEESGDVVTASTQEGIAAGVEGTPATFILVSTRKGYEVVSFIGGARPYEYIKAAIEEALAR